MRHSQEGLALLYKLGWLTSGQLSRLLTPAPKIIPSRPAEGAEPRFLAEPAAWSKTTAWRALEDLRNRGFAFRERTDNLLCPPSSNGGPTYAYALTSKKGIRAGALAAGESVSDPGALKKARAKYMRSFVDESRISHALQRNEWFSMLSSEALRYGVEVRDVWAEGGAVLRSNAKVVEPDGRVELATAGNEWLEIHVESDTGTQRETAMKRKVEAYGKHLIDLTDFGRDATSLDRLPLIVFLSKSGGRSERVLDYIAAELERPLYENTRSSLRRLGVCFDNIFVVTNLRWALAYGALGESCVAVGTEEFWAMLDRPYRAPVAR